MIKDITAAVSLWPRAIQTLCKTISACLVIHACPTVHNLLATLKSMS